VFGNGYVIIVEFNGLLKTLAMLIFCIALLVSPAAGAAVGGPDFLVFDSDGDQTLDVLIFGVDGPAQVASSLDSGGGTLTPLVVTLSGFGHPTLAASGDFDRDGDQDLALVSAKSIVFLTNNGGGGFDVARDVEVSLGSGLNAVTAMRAADLDRDGWTDLYVAATSNREAAQLLVIDRISEMSGDEATDVAPYRVRTEPRRPCCAVKKILSMGGAQLLVAETELVLLANDAESSPGSDVEAGRLAVIAAGIRQAEVADLDDDGDIDIVVLTESHNLKILLNQGDYRFVEPESGAFELAAVEQFTLADVDNDGYTDLVAAAAGELVVMAGRSGGRFQAVTSPYGRLVATEISRLDLHDLNFDGAPELLMLRSDGSLQVVEGEAKENLWLGFKLSGFEYADPRGARVVAVRKSGAMSGRMLSEGDTVVLGLGRLAQLDAVMIEWPQGGFSYTKPTGNNRYSVVEGLDPALASRAPPTIGKPIQFKTKRSLECR
jgi:hypothetical protein